MTDLFTQAGATFSDDRIYRYVLWRKWSAGRVLNMILTNPSKADEHDNDPTVERQVRRAQRLDFGKLVITNAHAFCATDSEDMKRAKEPTGPDNDAHVLREAKAADMVIVGWGHDGEHRGREVQMIGLLKTAGIPLFALRIGKNGTPHHPLYIPYNVQPQPFARTP